MNASGIAPQAVDVPTLAGALIGQLDIIGSELGVRGIPDDSPPHGIDQDRCPLGEGEIRHQEYRHYCNNCPLHHAFYLELNRQ